MNPSNTASDNYPPVQIAYWQDGSVTHTTTNPTWICPDLLSIRNIGGADGWRGHVVRGFFRLLKWVTGV